MSGIKRGKVYAMKEDKGKAHGRFFMTLLDNDIFMKIFELNDSNFMKT
jgi:hypothetical protein